MKYAYFIIKAFSLEIEKIKIKLCP